MISFIFVCLFHIDGLYADTIHLSPSQVNVKVNGSVTLTCFKANGQLVETRWTNSQLKDEEANLVYFNGHCITSNFLKNSDIYYGVCNGDGTYSVHLKRVDRTKLGAEWQCKEGLVFSNKVIINELVPVASVKIYPPDETYMEENRSQTISCKPSACRPQPTIGWLLRNPVDLTEYNVTEYSEHNNTIKEDGLIVSESLLNLIPNRSVNGWMLMCKAWNYEQTYAVLSEEVVLKVSFPPDGPPTINRTHNDSIYSIGENERGRLSCTVSGGNPLANITWSCFDSSISEIRRNGSVVSSVTWTALRYQDKKSCICVAEHPFGRDAVSVSIRILYKASILQFYIREESTEKNSFTVSEHDNVTFLCNTESQTAPNTTISHNGRIIHVSVNINRLVYTKKNIQCTDYGLYVCSTMNEYNNGKPSAKYLPLFVSCSPRPSPLFQLVKRVKRPRYTSATLRFSALAFPEPEFTWYYLNGSERSKITNNHKIAISSVSLHTSLTVINVTQSDYGQYILSIVNLFGVYEQKFILEQEDSAIYSTNVANSSSTAFVAVGVGSFVAALLLVGSVLIVYRLMNRKHRLQRNVHNDIRRLTEETPSNTEVNKERAEYEQIMMETAEPKASTSDTLETFKKRTHVSETLTGNEPTKEYEWLDESKKEGDQYSQLPGLYEEVEASRQKTKVGYIHNKKTQYTVQDYINIKI